MTGKKWIGHARLLAEVPSTSIEYCEVYKIPRRVGSLGLLVTVPRSLGPLFFPTPNVLGAWFLEQAEHQLVIPLY